MSVVTPEILIQFHDERVVADLVSDTGEQVADLDTDTKLLKIIAAAEGRVESACTVANIYTPTALTELEGNSLALFQEIVSGLAMLGLLRRRPGEYSEIAKQVAEYEEYLDRLRKGERVFGDSEENREAGLPDIDGPTMATYNRLNLVPERTRNFYPHRSTRLPTDRV